jgi:hypothetical protein
MNLPGNVSPAGFAELAVVTPKIPIRVKPVDAFDVGISGTNCDKENKKLYGLL